MMSLLTNITGHVGSKQMSHNFDDDDAYLQTCQYFTGDSDTMCLSSLKSIGPFGVIIVDKVIGSVKKLTIKSM